KSGKLLLRKRLIAKVATTLPDSLNLSIRVFHPVTSAISGTKLPDEPASRLLRRERYARSVQRKKKNGPSLARSSLLQEVRNGYLPAPTSAGTVSLLISLLVSLTVDRFVLILVAVG